MNIFDITANRIRQVKDGAVNDIEDLYASKSDIQTVLDSKADQADTYTKEQLNHIIKQKLMYYQIILVQMLILL